MKIIHTEGISNIEPLDGSGEWYWGTDYTAGDLYEAEELFRQGHAVQSNRLLFVHYPDGAVEEPIRPRPGQYFGRPIYDRGLLMMLLADFHANKLNIIGFDAQTRERLPVDCLSLRIAPDCYNLMLKQSPLMLTRQANDGIFQILWPQKAEFPIGDTESFCFRAGEKLYFSRWQEDPDYHEEVVVRSIETGEVMERMPGVMMPMPGGEQWVFV